MRCFIVLITILFAFKAFSQVIVVNYDELTGQYLNYSLLHDHLMKPIFAGEFAKQNYSNSIYKGVNTPFYQINLDGYIFKYIPFAKLTFLKKSNDTLFCRIDIDMIQSPSSTYIYKKDSAICKYILSDMMNNFYFSNCNLKEKFSNIIDPNIISVEICIQRDYAGSFAPNSFQLTINTKKRTTSNLSTSNFTIFNNQLSDYYFDLLQNINEFEPCKRRNRPWGTISDIVPDRRKVKEPWWKFW